VFDQHTPTRSIGGSLVGILGSGGIGQATATLFHALGANVHAINRFGRADAAVDQIGTMEDLDPLLAAADILVVGWHRCVAAGAAGAAAVRHAATVPEPHERDRLTVQLGDRLA
jgi:NAD(P)-dependent dehydrogenase (short-subunit alcohol dehydrogenase family)